MKEVVPQRHARNLEFNLDVVRGLKNTVTGAAVHAEFEGEVAGTRGLTPGYCDTYGTSNTGLPAVSHTFSAVLPMSVLSIQF